MDPVQGSWETSLFWYLNKFNQSVQGTFVRDASTEIFFASTSEHLQRPLVFDIFFASYTMVLIRLFAVLH